MDYLKIVKVVLEEMKHMMMYLIEKVKKEFVHDVGLAILVSEIMSV